MQNAGMQECKNAGMQEWTAPNAFCILAFCIDDDAQHRASDARRSVSGEPAESVRDLLGVREVRLLQDVRERAVRVRVRDAQHWRIKVVETLFHQHGRQLGTETKSLDVLVDDQGAARFLHRAEDGL